MPSTKAKKGHRKHKCQVLDCVNIQDLYGECQLCNEHATLCDCDRHIKKRKIRFDQRNKAMKQRAKTGSKKTSTVISQIAVSDDIIEFDPDFNAEHEYQTGEDNINDDMNL